MLRYAITDRARLAAVDSASQAGALLLQGAELAAGGIDYVQLREKDLEAGALAALARELVALFQSALKAPALLINSRPDIAVAVGAEGVHLTAAPGSLTVAEVRKVYASAGLPEPVVSVSCHTLSEIAAARADGATLILFGPVFEKNIWRDKPGIATDQIVAKGLGLDQLHLACVAAQPTPVLALGGLTLENFAAATAAGAAGVAGIRMFCPNPFRDSAASGGG